MKKRIAIMFVVAVVIGGLFYAYHVYETRYPSTDNAYVTANVVYVAPQVSGQVQQVLVHNQQYVHKSDRLYIIDARPFQLALEQARAHLGLVRQDVARDTAAVASAAAEVRRQEVLLKNAGTRLQRSKELATDNYVSKQTAEDAEADSLASRAGLQVARAHLEEAREKLGRPGDDNEAVREAMAALGKAQWQFDNSEVDAHCDGHIAQLSLQPGDAVQAGQSNFVLI